MECSIIWDFFLFIFNIRGYDMLLSLSLKKSEKGILRASQYKSTIFSRQGGIPLSFNMVRAQSCKSKMKVHFST